MPLYMKFQKQFSGVQVVKSALKSENLYPWHYEVTTPRPTNTPPPPLQ